VSRYALVVVAVLAFAGSPLAAQEPADNEVDIELTFAWLEGDPQPGDVTIDFADPPTRETVESWSAPGSGASRRVVVTAPEMGSGAGWVVMARAPGWWSPAVYLARGEREASLKLVPQGVVRFTLLGTDRAVGQLRSGMVWIDGSVWPGGRRLGRGIHGGPCEVDSTPERRDVLVACPFALGEEVDLRIRLGPLLPVLRSDFLVEEDTDLGLIEPVPGASVTGSLAGGEATPRRFTLEHDAYWAVPWTAWTEGGGFRFEGLAPGNYELQLAGAEGDVWPVRIESLTDWIDLGQLASAAANELRVSFSVPAAMDGVSLRPTMYPAELHPDGTPDRDFGRPLEPTGSEADGSFLWQGLPAGDYVVAAGDSRGNLLQEETLHFTGHDHFQVELTAVPLVGRITRGSEPLPDVMVWFGGPSNVERVSFRSGVEGHFQGFLPREGHWLIQITPLPACDPCEGDPIGWPGFDGRHLEDAGFHEVEADTEGVARVSIDLAVAAVRGRVLARPGPDGAVKPVAGAWVRARRVDRESEPEQNLPGPEWWTTAADSEGAFEMVGFPDGRFEVEAEATVDGRPARGTTRFTVLGDESVDRVEVWLEEELTVQVSVHSGGAPVAAAQVFALASGSARVVGVGYSGGSGLADLEIPLRASPVDLMIRAEGLGMNGRRVEFRDNAPVEIGLLPERGSLRLPVSGRGSLVSPSGVSIRVDTLYGVNDQAGQVKSDGDEWIVTDLAPGTWRYCPQNAPCQAVQIVPWTESSVPE